jgi:hypothetical protein
MVLRCFDFQVEGPDSAGYSTSLPLAIVLEYHPLAALQVLGGRAGAFPGGRGVGAGGVRVMAGGVGGFLDTCLLGWEGGMVLPLPFSDLAVLLAPLEIGHQCLFAALQDVNLHPHVLHCVMCTPSSLFFHHSKRAVLCVVTPYMIQRLLCVMNGRYCVMITRPLWPSWTTQASQTNIQRMLCCLRALWSSCSTSLLSWDVGWLQQGTSDSTTKVWLSVTLCSQIYCIVLYKGIVLCR